MKNALKEVFADDPGMLQLIEAEEQTALLKELLSKGDKEIPIRILEGAKGDKGDSPSEDELRAIIDPLIPEPIKGDPGEAGAPGRDGRDGETPTKEELRALIKPLIPEPIQGKDGRDASADMEDIYDTFIKRIIKEKPIDISQIRNANSFMFGGKRYKIEELMHGGGSSTTTSGKNVATQYLLTAVQSGSDVTIDLTQLSHYATFDTLIAVYRNNVPQTQGASYNFTATATTVTIFGADASEIYNITYSYT